MESWSLIFDISVLLTFCLLAGALFAKFKQSPLVGYLLAGIVMGAVGRYGLVASPTKIETIAELGVALLLFSLGLEFSWVRIRSFGRRILLAGLFQIVITLSISLPVLYFLGMSLPKAVLLACVFTLSSTATVLRGLHERSETDSIFGRNVLTVLLTQDLAVVPFAIVIGLLGVSHNVVTNQWHDELIEVLSGMMLLTIALFFVVRFVISRFIRLFTLEQNREMSMILSVIIGLGATWAAHALSVSPAIGAFLAGMFLGGSSYATQIRADIAPLRIVLLTLFFGAVGMVADSGWILNHVFLVLGVTFIVLVGKAIISSIVFKVLGFSYFDAVTSAVCLAQIGEFAFVLVRIGKSGHLVNEEWYQLIISVTIVTLFLTPYLISIGPRLGQYVQKNRKVTAIKNAYSSLNVSKKPCVIIFGFGPAGQGVAIKLKQTGCDVYVVDLNRDSLKKAQILGMEGILGDVQQPLVLEHIGVSQIRVIVITIPSPSASMEALRNTRQMAPDAYIVVRSRHEMYVEQFLKLGANQVISDEKAVSEHLVALCLESGPLWERKFSRGSANDLVKSLQSLPQNGA